MAELDLSGDLFLRTYYKCIVCERIYLSDEGYPGTKKEWPRRCPDHENTEFSPISEGWPGDKRDSTATSRRDPTTTVPSGLE